MSLRSFLRPVTSIYVSAILGFALSPRVRVNAAPSTPSTNQSIQHADPEDTVTAVAETPEPREYLPLGANGNADGYLYVDYYSLNVNWPAPPSGALSITGGGVMMIGEEIIQGLFIGDGATRPEFEWKGVGNVAEPRPKNSPPPTAWGCAGGAEFERGQTYDVSVGFSDSNALSVSPTVVQRPPTIIGGYLEWTAPDYSAGLLHVPKIRTETVKEAPLNPNLSRKTVGAGEIVDCELKGVPAGVSVVWSVSDPSCEINAATDVVFATFTAGDQKVEVTITATWTSNNLQGVETVYINVLIPTHESARKLTGNDLPADAVVFAAGEQGVYMYLAITEHPLTVSFSKIQVRELECDAVNFTGIILQLVTDYPGLAASFAHRGPERINADFVGVDNLNIVKASDSAGYKDSLPIGSWEWEIPVRWRVANKVAEHALPNRSQVFEVLDGSGTSKISKLNQTEVRAP